MNILRFTIFSFLLISGIKSVNAQKDTVKPVITLKPGSPGSIECRCDNLPYIDPGATASDNLEGDISNKMTVSGNVITNLPGDYYITYSVSDSDGNFASATRKVEVRFTAFYELMDPYFVNNKLLFRTDIYSPARTSYNWYVNGELQPEYKDKYTLKTQISDSLNHQVCIAEQFCNYDTIFFTCDSFNLRDVPRKQGIEGNVFRDVNSNCELDSTDIGFGTYVFDTPLALRIKNADSAESELFFRIFGTGDFFYECLPGTYTVGIDSLYSMGFVPSCRNTFDTTVVLATGNKTVSGVLMPMDLPTPDIVVSYPVLKGDLFPGEKSMLTARAYDIYQNVRTDLDPDVGGKIEIEFNGPVKLIHADSSGILPDSVNGNTVYYSVADFNDSVYLKGFKLWFRTDTNAIIDSPVCFRFEVFPNQTDLRTENNLLKSCNKVVNSHDPNYKTVYPYAINPGEISWLYYTIHFQNKGNASARNIIIRDTLDALLEYESIEVLDKSHSMYLSRNGRALTFSFPDIMLPDSSTDEAGSQGYVVYRVKTVAGLKDKDSISNTAFIYLDFNAPIVTNTIFCEVKSNQSSLRGLSSEQLNVYPNPATEEIVIELSDIAIHSVASVIVSNISGSTIYSGSVSGSKFLLDVSGWSAGIYLVSIETGGNVFRKLLVVSK